jgi:hypothetical protein
MIKQFCGAFALGCLAMLLASCAAKNDAKDDRPDKGDIVEAPDRPPAKPDPREITLYVDGMSEKLKLI